MSTRGTRASLQAQAKADEDRFEQWVVDSGLNVERLDASSGHRSSDFIVSDDNGVKLVAEVKSIFGSFFDDPNRHLLRQLITRLEASGRIGVLAISLNSRTLMKDGTLPSHPDLAAKTVTRQILNRVDNRANDGGFRDRLPSGMTFEYKRLESTSARMFVLAGEGAAVRIRSDAQIRRAIGKKRVQYKYSAEHETPFVIVMFPHDPALTIEDLTEVLVTESGTPMSGAFSPTISGVFAPADLLGSRVRHDGWVAIVNHSAQSPVPDFILECRDVKVWNP